MLPLWHSLCGQASGGLRASLRRRNATCRVIGRQARGEDRSLSNWFAYAAARISHAMGHYWAFTAALAICVTWALSGPLFGFSDTWQLVINTGTTVCTFLMVFLIQNTQNRESRAVQLKLDELIRAIDRANDQLIDIEEDTDEQLDQLAATYRQLSRHRQPPAGDASQPG